MLPTTTKHFEVHCRWYYQNNNDYDVDGNDGDVDDHHDDNNNNNSNNNNSYNNCNKLLKAMFMYTGKHSLKSEIFKFT